MPNPLRDIFGGHVANAAREQLHNEISGARHVTLDGRSRRLPDVTAGPSFSDWMLRR